MVTSVCSEGADQSAAEAIPPKDLEEAWDHRDLEADLHRRDLVEDRHQRDLVVVVGLGSEEHADGLTNHLAEAVVLEGLCSSDVQELVAEEHLENLNRTFEERMFQKTFAGGGMQAEWALVVELVAAEKVKRTPHFACRSRRRHPLLRLLPSPKKTFDPAETGPELDSKR